MNQLRMSVLNGRLNHKEIQIAVYVVGTRCIGTEEDGSGAQGHSLQRLHRGKINLPLRYKP